MRTFLWVVVGLNQLFLLLIGAMKLQQFELSDFALKNQVEEVGGLPLKIRRRLHKLLPEIKLLQRTELVVASSVSVALFGYLVHPALGVIYALACMLVVAVASRLSFVRRIADSLFMVSTDVIFKTTEVLHPLWVIMGIPKQKTVLLPASFEEFTDQLRRLPSTVLSPPQRQRLETILSSEEKTVKDIMTPKRRVTSVEPSATLGPIVLSDLEKSGHGYFPVATKKGEPEGILNLSVVADIHAAKERSVVRDIMSSHIAWAAERTSLLELTVLFLHEKQYLMLVKNEDDEYVGVVTVADLMKHLLGIVKE